MNWKEFWRDREKPKLSAYLDIFKSLGPGLIVAVGFVDPGNWASNIAAGSTYGYQLLWVVTISTIMLIILQHNAAHLGIVSGKCLSEAATAYMNRPLKNFILTTAMLAAVSTALAELLGGAIALQMLFGVPCASAPSSCWCCPSICSSAIPTSGWKRSSSSSYRSSASPSWRKFSSCPWTGRRRAPAGSRRSCPQGP